MRRTVFLCFLIAGLLLAGLATLRGAVLALSIPIIVYLLFGLWRAPEDIKLEIRRDLNANRIAAQAPVTVSMTVTNQSGDIEELALEDMLPPGLTVLDGSNRHLISLPGGKTFKFEYSVSGPRGGFPLEAVHIEAGDLLGIGRLQRDIRIFGQLFVLPTVLRIKPVPIRPRRTRVYAGVIPSRSGGRGVEFYGVRNYQPGDPTRHINWLVSARHDADLFSNEFQQERVADVGIVLDGRERSNLFAGGHSLFEHSVLAAASLADASLSQGNRVGLLVYSQYLQWTWPGYGKMQRARILHALSQAAPGPSQILSGLQYLPAQMFPTESQIVFISPLVEDDFSTLLQLRARRFQIMVVSPDPVSFEEHFLPVRPEVRLAARVVHLERKLMLSRIQRAGMQVIDWNVEVPFDQVAQRAFGRRAGVGNRL